MQATRPARPFLTALALAGTVLATPCVAQASVTVFGVVDAGMRYASAPGVRLRDVVSGGSATSRLGLRGSEDLGAGWRAGFFLESTLGTDTGSAGLGGVHFDRGSYVSLAGPVGEVRLGRDFTPAFRGYMPADPFGFVGIGGLTNAFAAASTVPISRAFGTGPNTNGRTSNGLSFTTKPTAAGLFANVTIAPGEGGGAGAFRYYGGRVGVNTSRYDATLYATDTRIRATDASFRQRGVSGRYTFTAAKLTFNHTRLSYLDTRQSLWLVGVTVPVGEGELKASTIRISQRGGPTAAPAPEQDATFLALGYVHRLSKRTALYATTARVSNSATSAYGIPDLPRSALIGRSSRGLEAGFRHAF